MQLEQTKVKAHASAEEKATNFAQWAAYVCALAAAIYNLWLNVSGTKGKIEDLVLVTALVMPLLVLALKQGWRKRRERQSSSTD